MKHNNSTTKMTNMGKFTFSEKKIDPKDAKMHQLLTKMGYDLELDKFYAEAMKTFGHYERPVVDLDINVLTHSADVRAAIENGMDEIHVYQVSMTDQQIREFIAMKHRYYKMNLIPTYETIKFYEDYLSNDPGGIALSEKMKGSTRKKIARLLHTSDSTIKRIKFVGDNKPELLGLIQEGEKSFKEAVDEIKAEKLKQKTEANKASLSTANSAVTPVAAQVVDSSNTVPQVDEEEDLIEYDQPKENFTSNEDNNTQSVTATNYNFSQGTFSIDGIGQFNVTVSNNKANLEINGKQLKNVVYEPIDDVLGAEEKCSRSFIFRQKKQDGLYIQLTIENFLNKAA